MAKKKITRTRAQCPVQRRAGEIQDLGRNLAKALRQLRRDLTGCDRCDASEDCPIRDQFNQQVDQVIGEITEEWNLRNVE